MANSPLAEHPAIGLLRAHFQGCKYCQSMHAKDDILEFARKRTEHLQTCARCQQGGDLCMSFMRVSRPADERIIALLCNEGRIAYGRSIALTMATAQPQPKHD